MSSLNCDGWQWLNIEPFNRCRRCHLILTLSSCPGYATTHWVWLYAGRPATGSPEGLPPPTGAPGQSGLPGGQPRLTTEKRPWSKPGAQKAWYKGYSTTHTHNDIITHTHRQLGLRNGPVKWPQRCGLPCKPAL